MSHNLLTGTATQSADLQDESLPIELHNLNWKSVARMPHLFKFERSEPTRSPFLRICELTAISPVLLSHLTMYDLGQWALGSLKPNARERF